MTYQTVLFDIDNTLINSADLIAETLRQAANKVEQIDVPFEKYRRLIGQPGTTILRQFGVRDPERVLETYMVDFTRNMSQLRYFPQIENLITTLNQRHVQVGVVTSKNSYQFDQETQYFPLIAKSTIITTADLTTEPKPSGQPLTYTLTTNRLDPATTLYVGDSIYDMQSANNAQIDFAAARWGALPDVAFETARYELKQPRELLALV